MSAATGQPAAVDPVRSLSRALVQYARAEGYKEIALGQGLLAEGEDGDFRLDLEDALGPDGLLPFVVRMAELSYIASRLNASKPFPMVVERDPDALLGERVVWLEGKASLNVVLASVADALSQIMLLTRTNPANPAGVLTVG